MMPDAGFPVEMKNMGVSHLRYDIPSCRRKAWGFIEMLILLGRPSFLTIRVSCLFNTSPFCSFLVNLNQF